MVANSQNTGAVLPTVPISTQKKRNNFAARRAYFPWLLIAPTLIIISAVIIYPMVYSVYVSFTPFNLLRPETFAFDPDRIFRNYERLWEDELFWQSLGNTVLFLAVTVNLEYVLALGLSQLIARVTFGQGLIRTLLMIPMMFAPVLVGFQFAWFFNATVGLVNNALMGFGLMTEPKAWLVDVPTGMMTIMLATIWMNVPITTVILLAGTLSLPTEIYGG
jgi:multiple sugar transport system permease protein